MSRIVHLVRHANYDMIGRGLAGRAAGHSLNDAGRAQAQALAESLADRPIAAIVSSPRDRTRETAMPLAQRLGMAVAIEPGFDEIDFGEWTGASFAALRDLPAWRAWNSFRSAAPVPGGETMLAAQARGIAAVLALPEGEVVVVSHGDIIKAVLAYFLGTPLDFMRRIEISPASRSVIRISEHDVRIDAINLPPHA